MKHYFIFSDSINGHHVKRIRKWIAALRSGEYQQATGSLRLHDNDTGKNAFCALGVMCDLQPNAKKFWDLPHGTHGTCRLAFDGEYGMPSWDVRAKFGLAEADERPGQALDASNHAGMILAVINDDGVLKSDGTRRKAGFKTIAGILEKDLNRVLASRS